MARRGLGAQDGVKAEWRRLRAANRDAGGFGVSQLLGEPYQAVSDEQTDQLQAKKHQAQLDRDIHRTFDD
jgi:hypothetical protein